MTSDVLEDAGYDFTDVEDAVEVEAPVKPPGTTRGGSGPDDSRPAPARRGRKPAKTRIDTLQKKLSAEMFTIGTMGSAILPVTGLYICQESDATTRAIVELASHRAEWVEALERIADIQPGLIIARTSIGIGGAIAVDRKKRDPDTRTMQFLGVYTAWKSIQDKIQPGDVTDGSRYKPPPVGVFQPVA